jgi:mannan endo-1,4-beta-mannosidase
MKRALAPSAGLLAIAACSPSGSDPSSPREDPPRDEGPPPAALDCPDDPKGAGKCYVRVEGGGFVLDGRAYRFMGTNFWAAPYVSSDRLRTELDLLQRWGVRNLRLMALSEGGIPEAQRGDRQHGPQRITPASSDEACADPALEAYVDDLEQVLDEIHSRGMKAVLTLNNWYHWSGGMPQYVKWAHERPDASCGKSYARYVVDGARDPATGASLLGDGHRVPFSGSSLFRPATGASCDAVPVGRFVIPHPNTLDPTTREWGEAWDDQQDLSTLFLCNAKAQEFFFSRAERTIERLKGHPGIMAWQLANEPRSFDGWSAVFRLWVERTARFIKDIDPNHLVSIGSEGELYMWGDYANSDYREAHALPDIDYLTFHIWPENWGWYDPGLPDGASGPGSLADAIRLSGEFVKRHLEHARALNKPAVVEEFGLARDDKRGPVTSSVEKRNAYYAEIFAHVSENRELGGVNFWAWGGTGRPADDGNPYWRTGDDYTGDPPHEQQGWYSVYATDEDTLSLVRDHAAKIDSSP